MAINLSGKLLKPEHEKHIQGLLANAPKTTTTRYTLGGGSFQQSPEEYERYVQGEIDRLDKMNRSMRNHNRLVTMGKVASTIPFGMAFAPGGAFSAGGLGGSSLGAVAQGAPASASVPAGTMAGMPPGYVPGWEGNTNIIGNLFGSGGTSALTGAGGSMPPGWTPNWEGSSNIIGNSINKGPASQPFFTGRDLVQFGLPAAGQIASTIIGTKANNAANREALTAQQAQYERTQAFLEQQQRDKLAAEASVEEEKKRQWEAEQAEKRRRYDAREPWRQAGLSNLTRMSNLLDRPKPTYVPYTGSAFTRG